MNEVTGIVPHVPRVLASLALFDRIHNAFPACTRHLLQISLLLQLLLLPSTSSLQPCNLQISSRSFPHRSSLFYRRQKFCSFDELAKSGMFATRPTLVGDYFRPFDFIEALNFTLLSMKEEKNRGRCGAHINIEKTRDVFMEMVNFKTTFSPTEKLVFAENRPFANCADIMVAE